MLRPNARWTTGVTTRTWACGGADEPGLINRKRRPGNPCAVSASHMVLSQATTTPCPTCVATQAAARLVVTARFPGCRLCDCARCARLRACGLSHCGP